MTPTTVVNLRREQFDVYIGRLHSCPEWFHGFGSDGVFGNPFSVAKEGRDEALRLFKTYFTARVASDSSFLALVYALRGKRLGCFCAPNACHGDVYVKWLEENFK